MKKTVLIMGRNHFFGQIQDILSPLDISFVFDGGDAQGFLPYFRCVGIVAAGDRAADIRLVALAGGPGYELLVMKDRPVDGDIVVLIAHGKDVVMKYDVPGVNLGPEVFDYVFAHRAEREGENR